MTDDIVTPVTPSDTAAVSAADLPPAVADQRTDLVAVEPQPAQLSARAPVREDSPAFSDFAVNPDIVQALADVGIIRTFAIQELTLPIALAGNDLIGQARTGTGKTLGFGVPLLNRLHLPAGKGALPQALVVAPTRELAVQVSADLASAGKRLGARVLTIYGGRAYEPQIDALRKGTDVVVGTPGRLLDLAQQKHLNLSEARILVLDEADEMLDLGFLPDIEKLLAMVPAGRQTMLFSATMPGPIVALARQFLTQPIQIRAEQGSDTPSTAHVDQFVYRAHSLDKVELITRVLQARDRGLTLIFARTKRTAAKVADELEDRGFAAAAIHGDLGQGAREQALRAFRSGKIDVLVATDVAARGLDVEGITHVVNYQAPEDSMTYVHRVGRTARAGRRGSAVTLVDWDDVPRWKLICDELGLPFHEPVETYSRSPHLYLELDIPTETTGTLPRGDRTRAGLDAEKIEDLGGRDNSKGARPARHATAPAERPARPARTSGGRTRTRTRRGAVAHDDTATTGAPGVDTTTEPTTGAGTGPTAGAEPGLATGAGTDLTNGAEGLEAASVAPAGASGSPSTGGSRGSDTGVVDADPRTVPGSTEAPDTTVVDAAARAPRRRRRGGRGRGSSNRSTEHGAEGGPVAGSAIESIEAGRAVAE